MAQHKVIPVAEHPSANDHLAWLVWSDRECSKAIYRVKAGLVACHTKDLTAVEGHFESEAAARAALSSSGEPL